MHACMQNPSQTAQEFVKIIMEEDEYQVNSSSFQNLQVSCTV